MTKKPHTKEIIQPVTTAEVSESGVFTDLDLGDRTIRNLIIELETMGLVETWIELKEKEGRVKQIQTTFEPRWAPEAIQPYLENSELVSYSTKD